ncbi:plasmid segregation protein ParM [Marinobacter sp. LV10R520-4]|uniref:ParM/StbA family protein n=1 Tax=Marinobacter sp. LV10R520-4 TaxID=1761796 RepID=UPI000BF6E802|nr:ParM/StbA family protein [Marinobacter sp. LV10R520-4]PFG54721.1 plasmid segregation protein ParM [Marinobacter sp. LV10R520-4]
MFILGMDIGYSNLKLVWGDSNAKKPAMAVYPSGAAPTDCISTSITSGGDHGGFKVSVNGEEYVAGIEQSSIDGWERVLSKEYPFSIDYKALFHASLMATKREKIDTLVTGLPVEQCADKAYKERVEKLLQGRHEISPGRFVVVHKVFVIPQPVGAYIDYLMTCENPAIVSASRVLVIDPGFFSVDWCAIDKGNFDKASSNSSQEAMSVLLEEAGKLVTLDHGRPFDLASIEDAARGDMQVPVFGKMVNLAPYLTLAATNVAETVMRKVRQNLRRSKVQGADFTLLAGGGADLYKQSASTIMEGSQVVTAYDPVITNAKGFFEYGRG